MTREWVILISLCGASVLVMIIFASIFIYFAIKISSRIDREDNEDMVETPPAGREDWRKNTL